MPRVEAIVINCREPAVLAGFYAGLLGLAVSPEAAAAITAGTLGEDESVLLGSRDSLHAWLTPALGTALGDPGATSRLRIFLDKRHLGPQRAVQAVGQYLSAERGLGRIPEGTDTHAVAVGLLGACQAAAIQARLTGQDEQWAQDQAATAAEGLAGLISRTGPAPG